MKLVRCNNCKHEYYINEFVGLSVAQDMDYEKCNNCGFNDYTILEDNIEVAYSDIKDDMDTQQEDIKHSLALFKEELAELVETYLEPFLK